MVRKSSGRMQETTPLIKQRRLIWHQAYGLTFTDLSPANTLIVFCGFYWWILREYGKMYKDVYRLERGDKLWKNL